MSHLNLYNVGRGIPEFAEVVYMEMENFWTCVQTDNESDNLSALSQFQIKSYSSLISYAFSVNN